MSNLKISLIQTELHWEDKARNLAQFAELISAAKEETDLIVLPEMFSTGFSMQPSTFAEQMDGATVEWMQQQAKAKEAVITGSIIINDGRKYYNRLIWAQPDGALFHYDKRHLFGLSN
jgi:omega-amidase